VEQASGGHTVRRRAAAVLVAGMVAVGCSTASAGDEQPEAAELEHRVIVPGIDGEPPRELTREEADEILAGAGEVTEADIAFVEMMIPHHEQALGMTRLVPSRTASESVELLAERMDISQADEIVLMADWLERQGVEDPLGSPRDFSGDAHEHHGHADGLMPGMLTEDEFATLAAAEGDEFDRLFLESMIRHHEGALEMIAELFEAEGGQNPEVWQLANHMWSDQEIEILRMLDLLSVYESS
jgi:uncharacterized protein (DUF305 family)